MPLWCGCLCAPSGAARIPVESSRWINLKGSGEQKERDPVMGRKVKTFRSFIVVLSAMALTGLFATAAFAQYPPAGSPGVTCPDAQPGGTVICSVVDATPGEVLSWTAEADGDVFAEGQVTADAAGEATFQFDVPTDVLGEVIVRVTGDQGYDDSTTVTVVAAADDGEPVEEDAPAATLPLTGGQIGLLVALALGLLAVGGLATRKKERQTAAV
jgi:hypothetical protein